MLSRGTSGTFQASGSGRRLERRCLLRPSCLQICSSTVFTQQGLLRATGCLVGDEGGQRGTTQRGTHPPLASVFNSFPFKVSSQRMKPKQASERCVPSPSHHSPAEAGFSSPAPPSPPSSPHPQPLILLPSILPSPHPPCSQRWLHPSPPLPWLSWWKGFKGV